MPIQRIGISVVIAVVGCWLVACGGGLTSPSTLRVPVTVIVLGQPFTATVAGRAVSADGAVDVEYAVGSHEVSGTFSGDLMVVGFGKGTSAGGVRIGSLWIVEGPGSIPVGSAPWQDGCVAVWGGPSPRPQPFRVRFTVTTDPGAACIPETAGS